MLSGAKHLWISGIAKNSEVLRSAQNDISGWEPFRLPEQV